MVDQHPRRSSLTVLLSLVLFVSAATSLYTEDKEEHTEQDDWDGEERFVKRTITHTFFTVLEVFLIVLFLVLLFLYVIRFLYNDSISKLKVPCYLCLSHLDKLDQKHREMCLATNKEDLEMMPTPRKVWCCFCSEKLRIWPSYKMTPFRCNSGFDQCPLKDKPIRCDGTNRFSCFLCDYTLCLGCVNMMDPVVRTSPKETNVHLVIKGAGDPAGQVTTTRAPDKFYLAAHHTSSPWDIFSADYDYLV